MSAKIREHLSLNIVISTSTYDLCNDQDVVTDNSVEMASCSGVAQASSPVSVSTLLTASLLPVKRASTSDRSILVVASIWLLGPNRCCSVGPPDAVRPDANRNAVLDE